MAKPLPKSVLGKMTLSEQKKLATLEKKYDTTGNEMKEAQSAAGKAMRKEMAAGHVGKRSAPVQRLINKGFKAEFVAFKAADALRDYKEEMQKKYT